MRTRKWALLLAVFVLTAAPLFAGQRVKTIRVGHIVTTEGAFHLALTEMDKELDKLSDGKIRLKIYPNGQLGMLIELIESVQSGNLDMAVAASAFIANFAPDLTVFDLPFLLDDYEQVDKLLDGEIGVGLLDKLGESNIKGLGWFEVGFRSLAITTKKINSVEDMEGLRLRTMSNKLHQELFRALGCDPVPMDWGDAFTALQQRAIDGSENSLSVMYDNKTYEVSKNGAITNHVYTPAGLIMSMDKWNSFTPEEQEIIVKAAAVAARFARDENRRQEEVAMENLTKVGMTFTYPEIEPFRKKAMAVYDMHPELKDVVAKVREQVK
jgi:tripartite ATP-independent periplasmic transporter solute receptor, DctP family